MDSKYKNFSKLVDVIKALRHPEDGCPWDLKQTHQSLLKYLLEESYEFIEAVENQDPKHMEEEIGDVLMQVLLHSELGSEKGYFDIESVSARISEKLIRRHPHVFENKLGSEKISSDQVLLNWEQIKLEEKAREAGGITHHRIKASVLNAPSLTAALKIGIKTQELKFDWANHNEALKKVEEELAEFKEEISGNKEINEQASFEELGDLLFSIAQVARHLKMDPDAALRAANKKFLDRFYSMEDIMLDKGVELEGLTQAQMDVFWDQAKVKEKSKKRV